MLKVLVVVLVNVNSVLYLNIFLKNVLNVMGKNNEQNNEPASND